MGNAVGSIFTGVGKILGHPLDFLSGKTCNSVCGPTWDFFCYIENFCVAQLLKFVTVAILVNFVLLFFYLLFSLGICQCICRTLCHIIWAFFSTYFSALHCCFSFSHELRSVKRRRRRRRRREDKEFAAASSSSGSEDGYEIGEMSEFRQERNLECKRSQVSKRKKYKEERLKKSLRPNSHRAGIELSGNSYHLNRRNANKNVDDHVRVTRTSKFSNKGSRYRTKARSGIRGHELYTYGGPKRGRAV